MRRRRRRFNGCGPKLRFGTYDEALASNVGHTPYACTLCGCWHTTSHGPDVRPRPLRPCMYRPDFLAGNLTHDQAQSFRGHLGSCEKCRITPEQRKTKQRSEV